MKTKDYSHYIGQKFGRLLITGIIQNSERDKKRKRLRTIVSTICNCGNKTNTRIESVLSGRTKSCGCLLRETAKITKTTHGKSNLLRYTKVYKCWQNLKFQCEHETKHKSKLGMLSKRWKSFNNFLSDMGQPPTNDHKLGRLDPFKPYCKTNCCWMLDKEIQERRTNVVKEYSLLFKLFHNFRTRLIDTGRNI